MGVAVLSLAAAVIFGCFWFFNKWAIVDSTQVAAHALTAETEVVFLGSSRFITGVDPSRLAFKAAVLAAPLANYASLRKLYNKHKSALPQLKAVVVEWNMADVFYQAPDHFLHGYFYNFYFWRLSPIIHRLFREAKLKEFRAGFLPVKGSVGHDVAAAEAKAFLSSIDDGSSEVARLKNIKALTNLIRELQRKNIKVGLLAMPRDDGFERLVPNRWHEMEKEVRESLQERFILNFADFRHWQPKRDEGFFDQSHLNELGAARFASQLNPFLYELMGVPQP